MTVSLILRNLSKTSSKHPMYCSMNIRGRFLEENIWVCCGEEQEPEGKAIVQKRWAARYHPTTLLDGPATSEN